MDFQSIFSMEEEWEKNYTNLNFFLIKTHSHITDHNSSETTWFASTDSRHKVNRRATSLSTYVPKEGNDIILVYNVKEGITTFDTRIFSNYACEL